jgi:hypothetical protein
MPQPTAYTKSTNFAQDESPTSAAGPPYAPTASTPNWRTSKPRSARRWRTWRSSSGTTASSQDGLVEYYNLSSACKAAVLATKWTSRGLWATATAYVVNDMVDVAGSSYICAVAHTSGTFATDYAAGKWQIFVAASTAGGVSFTPTTTVTSTTAQAAIEEVDTKLRAASLPVLSALYGAM